MFPFDDIIMKCVHEPIKYKTDDLVEYCRKSIANPLDLPQSCAKPLRWYLEADSVFQDFI